MTPPGGGAGRRITFRIPMRRRFRRVDHRSGVLLAGPAGWGEFSPFPDYSAPYTGRWYLAAREAATEGWPPAVRDRVPVNATIPAVGPEDAARIVRDAGCATVKVKVAEPGQRPADDLDRVEAVRDALGPEGRIRVDANAAWDVPTAVRRLRELAAFELEYAEQPVATLEQMAELRRRVPVPLALDEPLRLADDPIAVARRLRPGGTEAADVVVLKVQPMGGVRAALRVADAAGLPAVVSSALETSVGLAAGLALAAALPDLRHACGLGTISLLVGDVVDAPLRPVDGYLDVRRPDVAPELLARWTTSGDEAEDERRRLRDAQRAVEGT